VSQRQLPSISVVAGLAGWWRLLVMLDSLARFVPGWMFDPAIVGGGVATTNALVLERN
jgi:hypothetical protein